MFYYIILHVMQKCFEINFCVFYFCNRKCDKSVVTHCATFIINVQRLEPIDQLYTSYICTSYSPEIKQKMCHVMHCFSLDVIFTDENPRKHCISHAAIFRHNINRGKIKKMYIMLYSERKRPPD